VKPGSATGWNEAESRLGRFSIEVGEAHLDEGPDRVSESGLSGERERLLVALAHLLGADALFQPVVACDEQVLDLRADVFGHSGTLGAKMLQAVAVWHVIVSFALLGLILMHSGRDAGFGGMGFTPASQGGTHIVERNLTRLTILVATIFFADTVALFQLLK
jgi:preprotein translocase subunit SecG